MSARPTSDSQPQAGSRARANACFLDASILMYAAGDDHPLRRPCREALRRAVNLKVPLVTSSEVLQEILHRYFAIGRPGIAESVYASAVDLCAEVLPVTEADTARALDLLKAHDGLDPRDAVHIATMEAAGLRRILSTDRHFDAVDIVDRIDPAAFARPLDDAD